jgi:hypothetical protein
MRAGSIVGVFLFSLVMLAAVAVFAHMGSR